MNGTWSVRSGKEDRQLKCGARLARPDRNYIFQEGFAKIYKRMASWLNKCCDSLLSKGSD